MGRRINIVVHGDIGPTIAVERVLAVMRGGRVSTHLDGIGVSVRARQEVQELRQFRGL